jgi:hypothetical protein
MWRLSAPESRASARRSSWTLRVDLVGDFVCRLLNHMKGKGLSKVAPTLRPEDAGMPLSPWVDPENFNPGYVIRGGHLLPKQGNKPEWRLARLRDRQANAGRC